MDIILTFKGGKTVQVQSGAIIQDILPHFGTAADNILAVRVDNEICSLSQSLETNAELEPVLAGTTEGANIYRRTLCFVLGAAAHKLFPDSRLLVGHSLGYGYYYTFVDRDSISKDDIAALKHEMECIIKADSLIDQVKVSYKDATAILEKQGMPETRKLLDYQAKPIIRLNVIKGFYDIYVAPLLHSTGLLKVFDIMPYDTGFLLRFPASFKPDVLPEFQDNTKLFNIYKRYKEWGKRQNVTTVASLNDLVYRRKTKDFINISETFLNKNIADIADKIEQKGNVKVALLAGPSSSGKTTTSKKLAIQLKVLGYNPHVISLDNYYLGRDKTPRDENGDYDYECLEALDVAQLNDNLVSLFKGETIKVSSYDFREGKQYFTGETLTMNEKDILIMEGIHGLNDRLTPLVPAENKFKVYLSALTQLNIDDHNRISTSDNRLIRRIVRDSQFRGKSAADTIKMWPSVQRGEKLHIFPFQTNADAVLNTAMDYELAVLKIYASPLLRCVTPRQREYAEASRLLNFLSNFYEIAPTYVPGQSIIREFIGGSEFKY
ncbi:MAG: nucleoside kinase [Treponemataceae bacterium]|nr:nucleoside kinase [Treponemataceae bacterium]